MGSRALAESRAIREVVGAVRPGASRRTSQAAIAYAASTPAVIRNGALAPTLVNSLTVVRALIAVPPMPAPKTPIASPRRSGGNQAFTNGTPTANAVPAMPRKNPPTSSSAYESSATNAMKRIGTMVAAETIGNITRPPNLSVRAPTTIRPREPTITGTATSSATSDSLSAPSVPLSRNSGPSGLISAQAQKLTANPRV